MITAKAWLKMILRREPVSIDREPVEQPTEAEFWHTVCHRHSNHIATDAWCRRVLLDASAGQMNAGADGIVYTFQDRSALSVNSTAVCVVAAR